MLGIRSSRGYSRPVWPCRQSKLDRWQIASECDRRRCMRRRVRSSPGRPSPVSWADARQFSCRPRTRSGSWPRKRFGRIPSPRRSPVCSSCQVAARDRSCNIARSRGNVSKCAGRTRLPNADLREPPHIALISGVRPVGRSETLLRSVISWIFSDKL